MRTRHPKTTQTKDAKHYPLRSWTRKPSLCFLILGMTPIKTKMAATMTAHNLICRTFWLNDVCVAAAMTAKMYTCMIYPATL